MFTNVLQNKIEFSHNDWLSSRYFFNELGWWITSAKANTSPKSFIFIWPKFFNKLLSTKIRFNSNSLFKNHKLKTFFTFWRQSSPTALTLLIGLISWQHLTIFNSKGNTDINIVGFCRKAFYFGLLIKNICFLYVL